MKDEFAIADLETWKVFTDANRLAILQILGEPKSVKEVAATLGVPRTRLYHHINLMEEKGLIEVVDTRESGRIPEQLYQATAHHYRPADELLTAGDVGVQIEAALGAVFDVTRADLQRSVTSGLVGLDEHKKLGLSRHIVRLTPDAAVAFLERLESLVDELSEANSEDDDARTYALTWAFYPSSYALGGGAS